MVDTQAVIVPFTLVNALQRVDLERQICGASGLKSYQVALNSWGFPPIPIPSPRNESNKLRLAPQNVKEEFLGHPIYWIDPELTYRSPSDSDEAWSMRMFFLIIGFELWTPELNWVDYPFSYLQSQGVGSVDREEIVRYHTEGNPPSVLDRVPLLREEDLRVPLDRVKETYRLAAVTCADQLKVEYTGYLRRQAIAVSILETLIGGAHSRDLPLPEDPGELWDQQLQQEFVKLAQQYADCLEHNRGTREVIQPLYTLLDHAQTVLADVDSAIATVSIPVIRSTDTVAEAYSQMTAYLGIATEGAELRVAGYNIMEFAEEEIPKREPDLIWKIRDHVFNLYRQCWRRARLALVNFRLLQVQKPPFTSYSDLEADWITRRSDHESQQNVQTEAGIEDLLKLLGEN